MVLELGKKCDEERLEIKIDVQFAMCGGHSLKLLMTQIRNRLLYSLVACGIPLFLHGRGLWSSTRTRTF
jgi:hypothetical protein